MENSKLVAVIRWFCKPINQFQHGRDSMTNHYKAYINYYDYFPGQTILCEVCSSVAVDIHHIVPRSQIFGKERDSIENLIALCRTCHEKAHNEKISKEYLSEIHKNNIR